jgi:hypothetical protein
VLKALLSRCGADGCTDDWMGRPLDAALLGEWRRRVEAVADEVAVPPEDEVAPMMPPMVAPIVGPIPAVDDPEPKRSMIKWVSFGLLLVALVVVAVVQIARPAHDEPTGDSSLPASQAEGQVGPPVDCIGDYTALGACSEPCGPTGVAARTFIVTTAAANGGVECGAAPGDVDTQLCNNAVACPVDCVGDWGDFGACTETCGPNGIRTRTFAITTLVSNGGTACSAAAGDAETQLCNTAIACPVDCTGAMDDWSPCSLPCGGGTQSRNFTVSTPASNGGICPAGGTSETRACNTDACPPPDCLPGQYVASESSGNLVCADCAAGQHDDDNDPLTACIACAGSACSVSISCSFL